MPSSPTGHIDFEQIGATHRESGGAGTQWVATGIMLPDATHEALVGQIGAYRTAVFDIARLDALEAAAAGDVPSDATQLPLSEIGVSLALTDYLGRTADRELLVSTLQARPFTVTLWHLTPADIAFGDLGEDLQERIGSGGGSSGSSSPVYATIPQYESRNARGPAADSDERADYEATVGEQLAAASRWIDRRCNVAAGTFAPGAADELRSFEIAAGPRAFLRDDLGFAHALRSASAVTLTTAAGTATLAASDWRLLRSGAEPAIGLRRLGGKRWAEGSLAIVGRWGWGTTPDVIREATIAVARSTRDAERAGGYGHVEVFDQDLPLTTDAERLIGRLVRQYGRGHGGIR